MNICPACHREVPVHCHVYWDHVNRIAWHSWCWGIAQTIEKLPARLFQLEGIGL